MTCWLSSAGISPLSQAPRAKREIQQDDKHKTAPRRAVCVSSVRVSRIKRENDDAVIRLGPRRADSGADAQLLHNKISEAQKFKTQPDGQRGGWDVEAPSAGGTKMIKAEKAEASQVFRRWQKHQSWTVCQAEAS